MCSPGLTFFPLWAETDMEGQRETRKSSQIQQGAKETTRSLKCLPARRPEFNPRNPQRKPSMATVIPVLGSGEKGSVRPHGWSTEPVRDRLPWRVRCTYTYEHVNMGDTTHTPHTHTHHTFTYTHTHSHTFIYTHTLTPHTHHTLTHTTHSTLTHTQHSHSHRLTHTDSHTPHTHTHTHTHRFTHTLHTHTRVKEGGTGEGGAENKERVLPSINPCGAPVLWHETENGEARHGGSQM